MIEQHGKEVPNQIMKYKASAMGRSMGAWVVWDVSGCVCFYLCVRACAS